MNNKRELERVKKKMAGYTRFQQAVWLACLSIPKGQTRSYKWVAERIGRPKAFRAVGKALGKNPFAPTVPCHRVIAADGTPGGFSAPEGLRSKLKLLRVEGAIKKR